MELPEASDPQQMLQALLEFQKSMIEKQLQCVTHQNKPLSLSKSLLFSEYPRSSEHPTPSKHPLPSTPSSAPPKYSLFLKIYKELDRLLNQLRGWEDVFQKCLSDYIATGDVDFGNDFMKEVRENQEGVQNFIDESFKHGFDLTGVGRIGSRRHSRHSRHTLIYRYSSARRRHQLKMDRFKERRLMWTTDHFSHTYEKVLSRMLCTLQPIVKKLEQKQNELKMVSPAHMLGMERVEMETEMEMEMMETEREMEMVETEMEKEMIKMEMEIEKEMIKMEMEMEKEMIEMEMEIEKEMIEMEMMEVKELFGPSKKLAKMDAWDCVHLIREYHAVTMEQIRTLYILPLWFVNKEKLYESEKSNLESLERVLTENMADLDQVLFMIS